MTVSVEDLLGKYEVRRQLALGMRRQLLNDSPSGPSVYFVHATGTDLYKIGRSSGTRTRLYHLSHSSPVPLSLVALLPVPTPGPLPGMEQRCHVAYAEYRIHGEWFALPEEEVAEIEHAYRAGRLEEHITFRLIEKAQKRMI